MSPTCRTHCYAVAVERYRPAVITKYRRNLRDSRRRDFVRRVVAFLIAHRVRVIRIHTAGDFYSARYARKWLTIMRRSTRTTFYFYTRSWRIPEIKTVIDRMSRLRNCVVWYSCDRDTGVPADVSAFVRLAWLSVSEDDAPPLGVDLVFRIRRLRRRPVPLNSAPVCPAEDGVPRSRRVTCDLCTRCWRPPLHPQPIPLPVIDPSAE
jgi:hypothetical protein